MTKTKTRKTRKTTDWIDQLDYVQKHFTVDRMPSDAIPRYGVVEKNGDSGKSKIFMFVLTGANGSVALKTGTEVIIPTFEVALSAKNKKEAEANLIRTVGKMAKSFHKRLWKANKKDIKPSQLAFVSRGDTFFMLTTSPKSHTKKAMESTSGILVANIGMAYVYNNTVDGVFFDL